MIETAKRRMRAWVTVFVTVTLIGTLCPLPSVALAQDVTTRDEAVDVAQTEQASADVAIATGAAEELSGEGDAEPSVEETGAPVQEQTTPSNDDASDAAASTASSADVAASQAELSPASAPALRAQSDGLPSKFDLRERGVVTPVKQQNPFGSCWAFAATAATETSILSKLGQTYADTGFDLSERYLSWYVARPVTENISKSQVGEGLNVYNQEAGPNHIYNFGGREECAATLYAQGIGPQLESDYPYGGVNHRLAYEDLLADKEAYIKLDMAALREFDQFSSDEAIRQYAEADYEYDLDLYAKYDVYSPLDDWSVTDADEPGAGKLKGTSYTLTDNNVITYWVRKGTGDMDGNERYEREGNEPIVTWESSNLYQGSIDQIKAELYAGRGVSVDFSIDDNVINGETWAIYNDHSLRVSRHAVCIVGWDDDYAASNFTHTRTPSGEVMIDSSGRQISDERARQITTPAGDGAWICKNSWGSQTDMIPDGLTGPNGEVKDANASEWGIVDENGQHTGYFYLSYYDYTIGVPESFDFEVRENHDQENALQLDYLPASAAEWRNTTTAPMWEANTFKLEEDMRLDAVSTRIRMSDMAPLSGFDVTFDLYKLKKGATRPDDGEHLATCTRSFANEGYHRANLDAPVYLKAGDRLGVVVQQSHTFGDGITKYCVSAQEAISYRENPRWRRDPLWGSPVVNEGESFWKAEGITDQEEGNVDGWLDMTQPLTSALNQYLNPETWYLYENGYLGTPLWDFFNMDNFCIKAFGEQCALEHVDAVAATCETAGNVEYWRDPQTGATYADAAGTQVLEDVTVAPLGHDWGEPSYVWADDNSSVTATRICKRDATHKESEMAQTQRTDDATCTKAGKVTWTANFQNEAFQTQTKSVEEPALGHLWGEPSYVWADDNSSVTATRVCERDESHKESEEAETTREVTTQPTCEDTGEATWTVTFQNETFQAQSKSESLPSLGHEWDAGKVTKEPTTTESGVRTYTCTRCGATRTEEIPPTGTDPQTILYRCSSGDGSTWKKGSTTGLAFKFERSVDDQVTFSHFTGILVDDKEVAADQYEAKSGSVVVTLKSGYLQGLSNAKHTITALFDDGNYPQASFTVEAASTTTPGNNTTTQTAKPRVTTTTQTTTQPKSSSSTLARTGDITNILLPVLLVVVAAVVIIVAVFLKKRRS